MTNPPVPRVTARSREEIPTYPPRWAIFKGLLTGLVVEVPALAGGVWVLAQLGIGDADAPFGAIVRLTAMFAGIAAVLTAAGIGRLAAYASMTGGRKRAAFVAARAHAAASAGLIVIAAVPLGHLPEVRSHWLALPAVGLIVGAACGALIGVVCGGAAPVIGEVFQLAKKPTEILRALLDPEELVKLGIAVRDRTTHVFEGIFEPAAKPPATERGEASEAAHAPHDAAPAEPTTPAAPATTEAHRE